MLSFCIACGDCGKRISIAHCWHGDVCLNIYTYIHWRRIFEGFLRTCLLLDRCTRTERKRVHALFICMGRRGDYNVYYDMVAQYSVSQYLAWPSRPRGLPQIVVWRVTIYRSLAPQASLFIPLHPSSFVDAASRMSDSSVGFVDSSVGFVCRPRVTLLIRFRSLYSFLFPSLIDFLDSKNFSLLFYHSLHHPTSSFSFSLLQSSQPTNVGAATIPANDSESCLSS